MPTLHLAVRTSHGAALCALVILSACGGPAVSPSAVDSNTASSATDSVVPTATAQLEAAPVFTHGFTTNVFLGDPWDIVVADLNADGKPDLITGTDFPQGIVILFGHGDGTFEAGPDVAAGATKFVKAADLNGDGSLDLVAAADQLAVLLGHGDGTFQPAVLYGAGRQDLEGTEFNVLGLAIDDINGDAIPDLVAANWVASQLAVLIGRGDGSFDPASAYPCPHCDAVAIADLDADGDRDVVATGFIPGGPGTMSVFLNEGDGAMSAGLDANPQGNTVAVAIADLNGDTAPDVITGNDASQSISVLIGKGDGTFTNARTYVTGNTHTVVVVDLDGDGQLDILAGQGVAAKLWFYRGTGDGGMVETEGIDLTPDLAPFFAVADLNGDERLDLALYYSGASRAVVSVLLGE